MSESTDKRTATQRIEDLEKVATVLYQGLNQTNAGLNQIAGTVLGKDGVGGILGDISLLTATMKLLNKKTEAIIQSAAPETGITVAAVSALVVQMNIKDLADQVAQQVAAGNLVSAETVSENSFLVCEEANEEGVVVEPRKQFRLNALTSEETKTALLGKKAGETVSLGENTLSVKVLEIYDVVEPKAVEETPAAETAPAAEATTEAAPAEATAPEAAAPTATTQVLDPLPPESPIVQFVPSDASTMATA